jgi:ornithine cyclodeaminase
VRTITIKEIEAIIPQLDLFPLIEDGFAQYSAGNVVVPPVGEMSFTQPPGDVHIKYGYIKNDDYYVIKIASGFYENPKRNLPVGNGMMLIFDQQTGELLSIMLDQGLLTRVRTAVAGAIAAKHLAPKSVQQVGIIGAGNQARLQLQYLSSVNPCREAMVLGLTTAESVQYQEDLAAHGYRVTIAKSSSELAGSCNLIVTTTPSKQPVLFWKDIQPGTHITAVGADTPAKQELETAIFANADVVVADSISQCLERGDTSNAIREQLLNKNNIIEIGDIISGKNAGRTSPAQITVADLTGVAVQDIQITKANYEKSNSIIS